MFSVSVTQDPESDTIPTLRSASSQNPFHRVDVFEVLLVLIVFVFIIIHKGFFRQSIFLVRPVIVVAFAGLRTSQRTEKRQKKDDFAGHVVWEECGLRCKSDARGYKMLLLS